MNREPKFGVPEMGVVDSAMLRQALKNGFSDLNHAPQFGLFFAFVYVAIGWIMAYVTYATGQTYWLILAICGFPIIGPFAAVGLYEVSRRLQNDIPLNWTGVMGVVIHQSRRQLPSISAVIIVILMFWFFLGHMIFALFMGLSVMTNISTSYEVFLTPNGLGMLAMGTTVGAAFSVLVYMITVISLPLLLDREVDFVTAMITSFQCVQYNFFPMMLWAALIASATFVAMIPWFLGLFVVLPLFGHASWHLYKLACEKSGNCP